MLTNSAPLQTAKDSKVEKFRTVAKGLMAAIQANSAYVLQARGRLECSPKDTATLEAFLASDAAKKQVTSDAHTVHSCEQPSLVRGLPTDFKFLLMRGLLCGDYLVQDAYIWSC